MVKKPRSHEVDFLQPAIGEKLVSGEQQAPPKRLVIFGSRMSGAADLAGDLQRYIDDNGVMGAVVDFTRSPDNIEDAFFGRYPNEPDKSDNIPIGVVAYPEMRLTHNQYGMTIPTPIESIATLCQEHRVPLIVASREELQAGDIAKAVPALNPGQVE